MRILHCIIPILFWANVILTQEHKSLPIYDSKIHFEENFAKGGGVAGTLENESKETLILFDVGVFVEVKVDDKNWRQAFPPFDVMGIKWLKVEPGKSKKLGARFDPDSRNYPFHAVYRLKAVAFDSSGKKPIGAFISRTFTLEEIEKANAINIPSKTTVVTNAQKKFMEGVKVLKYGDTIEKVHKLLGKPIMGQGYYYLIESEKDGGFYFIAEISFREGKLRKLTLKHGRADLKAAERLYQSLKQ